MPPLLYVLARWWELCKWDWNIMPLNLNCFSILLLGIHLQTLWPFQPKTLCATNKGGLCFHTHQFYFRYCNHDLKKLKRDPKHNISYHPKVASLAPSWGLITYLAWVFLLLLVLCCSTIPPRPRQTDRCRAFSRSVDLTSRSPICRGLCEPGQQSKVCQSENTKTNVENNVSLNVSWNLTGK